MTEPLFGIDPVWVLLGFNALAFIGWTLTLIFYHRSNRQMRLAHFWWAWWIETAVRHGIEIGEDDLDAVYELAPKGSPPVHNQVGAVTETPERHLPVPPGMASNGGSDE